MVKCLVLCVTLIRGWLLYKAVDLWQWETDIDWLVCPKKHLVEQKLPQMVISVWFSTGLIDQVCLQGWVLHCIPERKAALRGWSRDALWPHGHHFIPTCPAVGEVSREQGAWTTSTASGFSDEFVHLVLSCAAESFPYCSFQLHPEWDSFQQV